jgi:hypothetical protein
MPFFSPSKQDSTHLANFKAYPCQLFMLQPKTNHASYCFTQIFILFGRHSSAVQFGHYRDRHNVGNSQYCDIYVTKTAASTTYKEEYIPTMGKVRSDNLTKDQIPVALENIDYSGSLVK